jgi:hypothetical protein
VHDVSVPFIQLGHTKAQSIEETSEVKQVLVIVLQQ